MDKVLNIDIHRGKDPSVQLLCGEEEQEQPKKKKGGKEEQVVDEGPKQYKVKIMFTGDMERQTFVESIMNEHKGGDDDEDDDARSWKHGNSDDEEEDRSEESAEEIINAVMYD